MHDEKPDDAAPIDRREFLTGLGAGVIGGGLIVAGVFTGTRVGIVSDVGTGRSTASILPPSTGYILVDSEKCAGCRTCMMACSLVHEGVENLTLSRIQVYKNTFGRFPHDIAVSQCRQCVYPACVAACPSGALHADGETGVRLVSEGACIGCQRCVEACPHRPSRVAWNAAAAHAAKCDLCLDAKYWNQRGGPGGKQACVTVCPMNAIAFASVVPVQTGTAGYDVNLKSANYLKLVSFDSNEAPPPLDPLSPRANGSRQG